VFLGWPGPQVFDAGERALLAGLGRYAAQAVARALLLEQQGAVAATLQQALLTDLPRLEHLQLHARYVPASNTDQVGGDWYDAVVLPDGATSLVIGDVVGHDLQAAAAMGQLRSMVRTLAWTHAGDPAHVLSTVDRAMDGLRAQTMATCLLARVEPGDGTSRRLRWSNAGHPSPLLVRADGSAEFLTGRADLPLGILTDVDRHDHVVDLPPGATLLLFTDGLVERRERTLPAGLESLRSAGGRHAHRDLDDLVTALLDELVHSDARAREGRHGDDVAVLAVRLD
jgi:serine phosphatase RsbU (regulator of sigma subunit)